MFAFITRLWDKMIDLAHYPAAWVTGFFLFVADAIAGGQFIIDIVVIASVIDLVCGIAVSIKRKQFARSDLMRQTVEKVVVYGLALLVFLCIDKVIEAETALTMDITSALVGVVITVTETWSFLASLLILFPNNPFLKLLQSALIGELARKLGVDESEVKATLEASRKKRPRGKNGRFISNKPNKKNHGRNAH